jgi:hypothetical protein
MIGKEKGKKIGLLASLGIGGGSSVGAPAPAAAPEAPADPGNSMADVASAGIGGAVGLAGGLMNAANQAETGHQRRVAEGQQLGLDAQRSGARNLGEFQNNAFQQLMGAYGSALAKKRR